ncbi:MAG: hypothetical protein H7Z41_01050, partial [Cytophagales bacterium]|nr:hypothetical protein [Armatimonadota bacterium]
MLTVYSCQTDILWEDKPANFARIMAHLLSARPAAGGLIVLPELFATGFSMNARTIAEAPDHGQTAEFLSGLARQLDCCVLAGVATQAGGDR